MHRLILRFAEVNGAPKPMEYYEVDQGENPETLLKNAIQRTKDEFGEKLPRNTDEILLKVCEYNEEDFQKLKAFQPVSGEIIKENGKSMAVLLKADYEECWQQPVTP